MNHFQLPGLSYFIFYLLLMGCENNQPEQVTDLSAGPKTEKISAEVSLINLSQDVKSHTLTFGNKNAFIKPGDGPAKAMDIHEKSFIACPAPGNPGLLFYGSIRVKVIRGVRNVNNDEIPPNRTNELSPGLEKSHQ